VIPACPSPACSAELRRGGDVTVAERLALLTAHRRRLTERIQRLQANGAALDEKIGYYRALLEET
jgi:outer membrane protein TolC